MYKPEEGKYSTYLLSKSITDQGNETMRKLEVGGAKRLRKKRYGYSNGTKARIPSKKRKTRRRKSNLSRFVNTYKRFEAKCL